MYVSRVGITSVLVVALIGVGSPTEARGNAVERPIAGLWEYVQDLEPVPDQCPVGQAAGRSYATGHLSHLGAIELEARGCIDFSTGVATGVAMYTAANGDELNVSYSYLLTDWTQNPDGSWSLIVPAGEIAGTGRFLNATVDATDTITAPYPGGPSVGVIEGTITYNASDRSNPG